MGRLSPTVSNSKLSELAREMSLGKLAPLALAIFALFGLLGPVIDIFSGGRLPLALVFRNTLLSGLVATCVRAAYRRADRSIRRGGP
jgi:hypothetical protein